MHALCSGEDYQRLKVVTRQLRCGIVSYVSEGVYSNPICRAFTTVPNDTSLSQAPAYILAYHSPRGQPLMTWVSLLSEQGAAA